MMTIIMMVRTEMHMGMIVVTDRAHVVVVKIGSNSLVNARGRLDFDFLDTIAKQLSVIAQKGYQPVLVTSGAVASGMGILNLSARPSGLPDRQALAAIGQATLAHRWEVALAACQRSGSRTLRRIQRMSSAGTAPSKKLSRQGIVAGSSWLISGTSSAAVDR